MAEAYTRFFKQADTSNDGSLTVDELTKALRANGYSGSDAELKKLFGASDFDGDNKVTLDEFLNAMGCAPPKEHTKARMTKLFRDFDKDGSGEIDKGDLHLIFKEAGKDIPEDQIQRMIDLVDKDGSGSLNYEEFMKRGECF